MWLTPVCGHVSLKAPLSWEHLNHTKDNQPSSMRKIGWVPDDNACVALPLETVIGMEQTRPSDQEFTGSHLMELSGSVVLNYGLGFHWAG